MSPAATDPTLVSVRVHFPWPIPSPRLDGADVRCPVISLPIHLQPVTERCGTGERASVPINPLLRNVVAAGDRPSAYYTRLLLVGAVDDDPSGMGEDLLRAVASYVSEWVIGEAVLAHLLAVLHSAVATASRVYAVTDDEMTTLATHAFPHAVHPDKLRVLADVGRGADGARAQVTASAEWIVAAATLCVTWIAASPEPIHPDRPLFEDWTDCDPRPFYSTEYVAYLSDASSTDAL